MEDYIEELLEQKSEDKDNKSEIVENNANVTEPTTEEEVHAVGTEVICIDLEESDIEENEGEEIKTLIKEMDVSHERQNKMLKKIAWKESNLKDLMKIVRDKDKEIDDFKLQVRDFEKQKACMENDIGSLLLEVNIVKSKLSKEMENNVNLEVELAKKTKDWNELAAKNECKIIAKIALLENLEEDVKKKESEIISLKLEIEKLRASNDRKSYKTQSQKLGVNKLNDMESNAVENAQDTPSVSDLKKIKHLEEVIKRKDCKIMSLISKVKKLKKSNDSNSQLAKSFKGQPLNMDVEKLEEDETCNDTKDQEIENLKLEIEKLKCLERKQHCENESLKAEIEKFKQSEEKKDSDVKSLNFQVEQLKKETRTKDMQIKSLNEKINELKLEKDPQEMAIIESEKVYEISTSTESEEKTVNDSDENMPTSREENPSCVKRGVMVLRRRGPVKKGKYSDDSKTIPNDKQAAGISKTATADVESENVYEISSSSESEEMTDSDSDKYVPADSDSDEYVPPSKKKISSSFERRVIVPNKKNLVKKGVYSDDSKTTCNDKQAAGLSKTADEDNSDSCDDLPILNIQSSSKYTRNQKTSVTTRDKAINSKFANNTGSSDNSANLDSNRDNAEEKDGYDQGTIYYQKNTGRKPTWPKLSEMVKNAIKSLKKTEGSSLQAIKEYITVNYKVDEKKLTPFINKYLKSAVQSGELVWTNGLGADGYFHLECGSFRLAYSNSSALSKSSEGESKSAVPDKEKKKAATTRDLKSFEDLLNDPRVELLEKYYSPRVFPNKAQFKCLARILSISVPIIREWFRKKWQNEKKYLIEEDLLILTEEQLQVLENVSKECIYPKRSLQTKLSNQLDIPLKQVRQWFNMKISGKRGNLESFKELLNDPRVKLIENYFSKISYHPRKEQYKFLAYELSISEDIIREWFREKMAK